MSFVDTFQAEENKNYIFKTIDAHPKIQMLIDKIPNTEERLQFYNYHFSRVARTATNIESHEDMCEWNKKAISAIVFELKNYQVPDLRIAELQRQIDELRSLIPVPIPATTSQGFNIHGLKEAIHVQKMKLQNEPQERDWDTAM